MKTILLLVSFVLATYQFAKAQQATKVPRIGYLNGSSLAAVAENIEALLQGLRDLGYVEGKRWLSSGGARTEIAIVIAHSPPS